MIAYALLFLFAVGIMVISRIYSEYATRKFLLIVLWVGLTLFAGFRHDVGMDYMSYLDQIQDYRQNGYVQWEYAYQLFLGFASLVGLADQSLYLAMAMLTAICFYGYISYHSKAPLLSTFFFLALPPIFLSSLNISRQFVAIAIFAFALRYIVNKKLLLYCFFIMVAFSFHKSAIFALPLYYFLGRSPTLRLYVFIMGAYLLSLPLIHYVAVAAGITESYFVHISEPEGITLKTYAFVVTFLSLFFLARRLQRLDPSATLYINMVFLMALLSITPAFIPIPSEIYWRVLFYFFIAAPIMIVNVSSVITVPVYRAIYLMVVTISATGYYFYTIVERGIYFNLVPYDFNFSLFDLY